MYKVITYLEGVDDSEEIGKGKDMKEALDLVDDYIREEYDEVDVHQEGLKWTISGDHLDFNVCIEIVR